jgi:2,3,4,5-tetrahydropyridine-2,6-dicarboxylate N-succinyltransferase
MQQQSASALLRDRINVIWERRDTLSAATTGDDREAVEAALAGLDDGSLRVAEPQGGGSGWIVHEWLKKAVLLSFRLNDSVPMPGAGGASVFDKVPMKFAGWDAQHFAQAGFRAVPGAVVRRSAYVAPGVVLMPCFVNAGARIETGTMIDTWSTVGSCAQVGRNCHISGGVGIGGVLEPLQAAPVIIEDDCFIGARSEVAEGVVVERGSVLSMGVFLGASTKIVDRATGEIFIGRVPAYSVVVPGSLPAPASSGDRPLPALACAVIVKRVDERTRAKTAVNELLRD